MRTKRTKSLWLLTVCTLASCSDQQRATPTSWAAPPQHPFASEGLLAMHNGVEYEMDTGEIACPAILNSNVKKWVDINAVGSRLFTFFAPHTRIGYLGRGVYRYRMTLGRSDDGEWLAEGPWTGRCVGYGQWGIGRVLDFEGTIWRVGDDSDECGGGGGDEYHYMESYDPYAPGAAADEAVLSSCGSGGGSTFDPEDYACHWDYITIEISYDGGQTWQDFWSGWAQVCDNVE